MSAFIKTAVFVCACMLGIFLMPALAQDAGVQRIAADGSTVFSGRPTSCPPHKALAEKPLAFIWAADSTEGGTPGIQVCRITDTRRVKMASGDATRTPDGWSWEWTPPQTKAVVTYEVVLSALPKKPILLEVYDAKWLSVLVSRMAELQFESQGLIEDELTALKRVGVTKISNQPGIPGQPAFLRLISAAPANQHREIFCEERNHQLVVWRPGNAVGDFSIVAPRWWMSPEALATDHGIIRLIQLLAEPPAAP